MTSRSRGTFAFQREGGSRLLFDDLPQRLRRRVRPEWRPSRQRLVQNRPQRVDVRGRSDRVRQAQGLLGGHVVRRAQRDAASGQPRPIVQPPGQPEVGDLGGAVGGQEDVARLQVAVNDTAVVGRLDGLRQRRQQRRRPVRRQGDAGELLGEAAPFDEFHGEVRPARRGRRRRRPARC